MRNKLTLVVAGLAAFAVAACNTDNITKVNTNPNNPTDAPAGAVFTQAVSAAVGRFMGSGYNLRATALVIQHFAEVQYPDEDQYKRIDANSTQGYFTAPYVSDLEDLRQVANKGLNQKWPGIYAPALIMQTWDFGYITDTFGDVPYSQALRGDSTGGSLTPAYDAQKDIYTGFFTTLGKAVTDLAADATTGKPTLGNADAIYGGNELAWQKFANSLRLRYAMRLANVDPGTADAQIKAALAASGGVFASNADNAILKWPGDGIFDNPWAGGLKGRDDFRMSQTLMNLMTPYSDPRVPMYAMQTVDFTKGVSGAVPYAGMPNGLAQSDAGKYFNNASRPGAMFYPGATAYGTFGGNGAKLPTFIMTFAEVQFILAEAAERGIGGVAGTAKAHYDSAVTASIQQWSAASGVVVSDAQIATFLGRTGIAYVGGTDGLKQIATQKYIALLTDGGNAWAEWRRTCIPNTIAAGPAAVVNFVPRRFYYPPAELSANGTNLQAAIARQGADDFGTRVYWDTKPSAAPTCQ